MLLVDLGILHTSPRVRQLMETKRFDTSPFLFAHKRGDCGDAMSSAEIFAHITDVCRGRNTRSAYHTKHGVLHLVTQRQVPPVTTMLAMGDEL